MLPPMTPSNSAESDASATSMLSSITAGAASALHKPELKYTASHSMKIGGSAAMAHTASRQCARTVSHILAGGVDRSAASVSLRDRSCAALHARVVVR